jgi:hypothetical protein
MSPPIVQRPEVDRDWLGIAKQRGTQENRINRINVPQLIEGDLA